MITLSDNLLISLPLPTDARQTNLMLSGSKIIVESKVAYLLRVDMYSRYLGMEVSFVESPGIYDINVFISKVNSGEIFTTKYAFYEGITDAHFKKVIDKVGEGGEFDPTADIDFSGNNTHSGTELFDNITISSDVAPTSWLITNETGDLSFNNESILSEIIFNEDGIVSNGFIVEGETGYLKADGTVEYKNFIEEEVDPIFSNSPANDINEQDIINIKNLSGINTGDQDLSNYVKYIGATNNVNLGNYFINAQSYKIDNITLLLNSFKYNSVGQTGSFLISTGTTTDPLWKVSSDINISGFNNDSGYLTSFVETDPIWLSEKNNYYTKSESDNKYSLINHTHSQYLPGGAINSIQYNNNGVFDGFGEWNNNLLNIQGGLKSLYSIVNGGIDNGYIVLASDGFNNIFKIYEDSGVLKIGYSNILEGLYNSKIEITDYGVKVNNSLVFTPLAEGNQSPTLGMIYYNSGGDLYLYTDKYGQNEWIPISLEQGIIEELDPIFTSSPAFNISLLDISNWNASYSWGDHSTQGYATEVWTIDNFSQLGHTHNYINSTSGIDNAVVRFNGTENLQDSLVFIDDLGNITGVNSINLSSNINMLGDLIIRKNSTDTASIYFGTSLTHSLNFTGVYYNLVGGTLNTTGYSKDGSSLLLDKFKFGSLGASGTIPVSQGSTTNFIWTNSLSTIKLTSGAIEGYYWKCTNGDGSGAWFPISESMIYKGTWDANLNTPTLTDGIGTVGWFYRVTVSGTWNSITFNIGDDIVYNGSTWERIPGQGYTLQIASNSVLGGVKIGDGINIDGSGIISVSTDYQAPLSGSGFVKIDGTTISYDSNIYITENETISLSGDISGTGKTNIITTLATVATPGTYKSVTIDAKGRVLSGTNPTTLNGYGITDAQPLDGDLSAISALSGTGLLKRTGVNTWVLDTTTYLSSFTETDPIWIAEKNNYYTKLEADGIFSLIHTHPYLSNSDSRIVNWDEAFSWGDHSEVGYALISQLHNAVTVVDSASIDFTITGQQITGTVLQSGLSLLNLGEKNFSSLSNKPTTLSGYGITDAYTKLEGDARYSLAGHTHSYIPLGGTNGQLWKSNGTGSGSYFTPTYLTSYTETDPIFVASPSYNITSLNITNWNTSYSWGNHATAGYLTSYTETDPVWNSEKTNYYTKTQSDARYELLISKASGYLTWNGTSWVFKNEIYSLSTHNHDLVYSAINHTHTSATLPNDIVYTGNNISLLINDAGYLTNAVLEGLATESWVSSNYSPIGHTHAYDNYVGWTPKIGSTGTTKVTANGTFTFAAGPNIGLNLTGLTLTISNTLDLSSYATQSWVGSQGFSTTSWVTANFSQLGHTHSDYVGLITLNGSSGSYPGYLNFIENGGINISKSSGDIYLSLESTGVTSGVYTNSNVTVDSYGRITSISSGTGSQDVNVAISGESIGYKLNGLYFESSDVISLKISDHPTYNTIQPVSSHGVFQALFLKADLNGNSEENFSGNIFTGTNFVLGSDLKLKTNIEDIENIDWVDDIKFKSFNFNSDLSRTRFGVIAQDLEKINKNLIYEGGYKTVSYIDLLVLKIARLEQKIKELQNE